MNSSDWQDFSRRTVTATLQCAGNWRRELDGIGPIPGHVLWDGAAIGTATFSGVSLGDLLALAGPQDPARHVALEGIDEIDVGGRWTCFGVSVPIEKARSPEVLLADTMNGQPLPPTHGAPIRAVVPGYIGARSVKWLTRITLRATPSDNYFHTHTYRLPPRDNGFADAAALYDEPVSSVVCNPVEGATVPAGNVTVDGWAHSGGGRSVTSVEVSADAGTTWTPATLSPRRGRWAWRLWQATLSLPTGHHHLVARAVDDAAGQQPEHLATVWNQAGYLNNAWSGRTISVHRAGRRS